MHTKAQFSSSFSSLHLQQRHIREAPRLAATIASRCRDPERCRCGHPQGLCAGAPPGAALHCSHCRKHPAPLMQPPAKPHLGVRALHCAGRAGKQATTLLTAWWGSDDIAENVIARSSWRPLVLPSPRSCPPCRQPAQSLADSSKTADTLPAAPEALRTCLQPAKLAGLQPGANIDTQTTAHEGIACGPSLQLI